MDLTQAAERDQRQRMVQEAGAHFREQGIAIAADAEGSVTSPSGPPAGSDASPPPVVRKAVGSGIPLSVRGQWISSNVGSHGCPHVDPGLAGLPAADWHRPARARRRRSIGALEN